MMQNKHEFECSYIIRENEKIFHGFIDLIAWHPEYISILDFKTDTVQSETELIDKYHAQLDTYKKAIHTIEPDKKIKTYIYSFHLMKNHLSRSVNHLKPTVSLCTMKWSFL